MERAVRVDDYLTSLKLGDVLCFWKTAEGWYLNIPDCGIANLAKHTVIEEADGSLTVSPSILVEALGIATRHGFLEKGVWREV